MCGIITYYNPEKHVNTLDMVYHYREQRNRGHDGFGFTYIKDDGTIHTLRYEDEATAFYMLSRVHSHLIMFHHRFPTSTLNKAVHNHPITRTTACGIYTLIHNGVINNADDLRKKEYEYYPFETEEGIKFNDSECLLHSLVDVLEGRKKEIIATGSVAFVLLKATPSGKATRLYFGRNFNPLYTMKQENGTLVLSSSYADARASDQADADILFNLKLQAGEVPTTRILEFPSHKPFRRERSKHAYEYEDDWEERYPHNSDGKWLSKYIGPKKEVIDITPNLQQEYLEALKMAQAVLGEVRRITSRSSIEEKESALRDIADVLSILTETSVALHKMETEKCKSFQSLLGAERARIVMLYNPPLPILTSESAETIQDRINMIFGDPMNDRLDIIHDAYGD